MLVLSRKKNESIVINNDIKIVVVEIRGDKVRLGVEAPRSVSVHRREVYETIQRTAKQDTETAASAPAASATDGPSKMKPSSPELDDQFPHRSSPMEPGDEGTDATTVAKDGVFNPFAKHGDSDWEN